MSEIWNADVETNHAASSEQEPFLITFEQLKEDVVAKWIKTGEKNYRVLKKTIFNPPSQSYNWEASHEDHNGNVVKKDKLSIQLV